MHESSSSSIIFCALLFIIIFGVRGQTDSGAECRTSDGKRGFCLSPSECKPSLFTEPTICEYSETGMKLCCVKNPSDKKESNEDNSPLETKSEEVSEGNSTPVSNSEEVNDRYFPFVNMFGHPQIFPEKPFTKFVTDYDPYRHRPRPSTVYEWFYSKPKESKYNVNHGRDDDYPYEEPIRDSVQNSYILNSKDYENTGSSWNYNNFGNKPEGSDQSYGKKISEVKCEEYSRLVSQTVGALHLSLNSQAVSITHQKCEHSPLKLIVGGEPSKPGEFPHMAAVGFQKGDNAIMWICGGTLISDKYILTAGHCTNTTYGNPVVVRLGEYNLRSDDDGAQPHDYAVTEVIPHPQYVKSSKYNDIALLRLSRVVEFTKGIRPACLHQGQEKIPVNTSIATGWGRTDYGQTSDKLMKVSLSIIDNTLCNEFYLTSTRVTASFPRGIIDTMLCAGEIKGGVDTCFGDSGGPLQITRPNNQCVYYIVGVTSFGKVCGAARSPGVYTRVSSFIPWIESVVW